MKSLALKKYFEIINPIYSYLQIIPHKSNKNCNSSEIAKAMSSTYKSLLKRVHKEQKKVFVQAEYKISYIIDINKTSMSFYFLVPSIYKQIIVEKIISTWNKCTIQEVDNVPKFTDNKITYQLGYKKDDALSLKVDKRTNEPLNNILNVADIMQEGDRILVAYNFMPCSQYGWLEKHKVMVAKFEQKKPLDKKITFEYVLKLVFGTIATTLDCILTVASDFLGDNERDNQDLYKKIMIAFEEKTTLSNNTINKRDSKIIETQIAVISDSLDKDRKENNALAVCQSYNILKEDNEFVYKKTKSKFKLTDYSYKIDTNLCSSDECKNYIQIPGNELIKQFKINHIETTETEVPTELRAGTMSIGTNICKGNKQKAFLSTDKDFRNLVLCLIGPNRCGKTTLLENLSVDAITNGECVFIFDFCGQCELSEDIKRVIDKSKVLDIDCSDFDKLEGLGYNEIFMDSNNPFKVYNSAKMQTSQLVSFINSINITNPLEPRMARYLKAAALIVFISKGNFKEVFNILQDHVTRKVFLDKIPRDQLENLEEYILTIKELDEWSKATKDSESEVIGTKISFIQGILNRLDSMKSNSYMELMLKKDCSRNINLVEEMQKPQLICLKMPETMFSTDEEKDIYCTYWFTKIWGALQQRHEKIVEKDRIKVNLLFDELYQVINCQTLLKTKLNQIAKKTCKPIISCHSLEQIKYIRPELKSASTSYMLISGCDKQNYIELKEELEPYEMDDLLNLKRYNSLNLIKCNSGYARFITALPTKL